MPAPSISAAETTPSRAVVVSDACSALSYPKTRLLRFATDEWQKVPPATRSTTVIALVKAGLLEHRHDPTHSDPCLDWMTWGEIRLPQNVSRQRHLPADD